MKKSKIDKKISISSSSFERKRQRAGFYFVLIWIIGCVLFFIIPLIQSLEYSFFEMNILNMSERKFIGFEYYNDIFRVDPDILQHLTTTVANIFYEVPIIVIFSLFMAVILNKKFKGRALVRAVFFLPVIVTTGIVLSGLKDDSLYGTVLSGNVAGIQLFNSNFVSDFLSNSGLSEDIIDFMTVVIDRIFDTIWASGIQILLFLAAIQGISGSLYEASDVEGATKWESFWLITFPMVSPVILVVMVYTIIDSFSSDSNLIMQDITNRMSMMNFGYAAALSWVYFITVFLILGVLYFLVSKLTHASNAQR